MAVWDDYKITIPKAGNRGDDVSELEDVKHVVHPAAARRILEDKKFARGSFTMRAK